MKKKYLLLTFLFVCGLFLVSIIKNETRMIQKEINNLKSSIRILETELHRANLDYNVAITPENLLTLIGKHLEIDFDFYDISQIKKISINEIIYEDVTFQFSKI